MKLLAFETSTEACSVAVQVDGCVIEHFEVTPRRHAELALPWAEQLLAEAGISRRQLDAIAFGCGPGAFTGVRLAISLAQGIALALDLPLLPVSTLRVLAMRAVPEALRVLASIDARMGEVYTSLFVRRNGILVPSGPESVCTPDSIVLLGDDHDWHAVGTGLSAGDGLLQKCLASRLVATDAFAMPHAVDVLTLASPMLIRGEGLAPEAVEPVYLRNNVARTVIQQCAGSGSHKKFVGVPFGACL
ncbi:MAG TPA: tRNA (adenosine(37)-N6)-threonylcarbamoyltransferase complex dimerization subunit type 1 TsaB [Xylella sp.]